MQRLIKSAVFTGESTAIIAEDKAYTYHDLLSKSAEFAGLLLNGKTDLEEARVCFMVTPGFDYVKVQWAIWQAGGMAVPLCLSHPLPSLQYVIEDSEADIIVVAPQYEELLNGLATEKNIRLVVLGKEQAIHVSALPDIDSSRRVKAL